MGKRLRRALVAAAAVSVLSTSSASAATDARVVIVWLEGTSLNDWATSGGPALRSILSDGAVATLHTGYASTVSDAALEAGASPDGDVRSLRPSGVRRGLGETLSEAGRTTAIFGTALPIVADARTGRIVGPDALRTPGSRSYAIADATSPTRSRTDVLAMASDMLAVAPNVSLVVADIADTGQLDRSLMDDPSRERWIGRALSRADAVVAAARTTAGADGTVVIISAPGPAAHQSQARLGAIAMIGQSFGRGALTSETTRVPGLVTLEDVTPTLLKATGLTSARGLTGSVMTVSAEPNAAASVVKLDRDLLAASVARERVALGLFGALAFASLMTGLLFVARRGRAPRGSAPIHLRDVALIIFASCAISPAVLLLDSGWRAAAVAGICGVIARVAIGARWCVPVLALAGVAPAIGALFDPRASAVGSVGGARASFIPPGMDPALAGLALGAGLLAVGMTADSASRSITSRRARTFRVAAAMFIGAGAVALAGDPRMIAVVTIPVAWFIARGGTRSTVRSLIGVSVVALFGGAAVVSAGPEPFAYASEASRWIADLFDRLDVVSVAALAGAPLAITAMIRRDEVARASFGSPGLRASVGATVFAALAIAIAYPGGTQAAAWTLLPAVCVAGAILTGSRSSSSA